MFETALSVRQEQDIRDHLVQELGVVTHHNHLPNTGKGGVKNKGSLASIARVTNNMYALQYSIHSEYTVMGGSSLSVVCRYLTSHATPASSK